MKIFISARNLFFIHDFGDNGEMSENNLINQSRLESARKRRASRQKSHIETQCNRESSSDKSSSKVLILAPKFYARNSFYRIPRTQSGSENVGSSSSYSPMLLAALIREVENLDVPNGPFYL